MRVIGSAHEGVTSSATVTEGQGLSTSRESREEGVYLNSAVRVSSPP